ncbi:MAG: DUF87 domain-containing protein [Hyphomicrobiales bacterium]|nr:DUF87 domain-containing protein [Hyphomicrobiales bacterium]
MQNNQIEKGQQYLEAANNHDPIQLPFDNDKDIQRNRTNGHVVSCDGKTAVITAVSKLDSSVSQDYWSVGQLISVKVGNSRIVGLIFKLESPGDRWKIDSDNPIQVHIELIGEIIDSKQGQPSFKSGISNYPHLGAVAHRIRNTDLAAIYENNEKNTVTIGSITQDSSIPAMISVDSLLSRHFAIVGTTGVGKSTSVALILRKVVEKRPDIRTLILDPHNEFAKAFPESSVTVDASSLDLPFWMFTLEEFVEVIYRGRPGIGEEVDTLRDLIPEAKFLYENGSDTNKTTSLKKNGHEGSSYTADTPVPYRMADLFKLIDNRLGLLDSKAERPHLKSLRNRIDLAMNDPRFNFMFDSQYGADAMGRLLSLAFRIPQNNKPICVFELSGLPSEIVNVVASVMCRLAFDLGCSSHGTIQTLVVCEEAHRYIPADTQAGFLPTRLAISKIAKEGRKYGVFLGVITQRPGELDATILSQCNTIFSMRLGNDHDQAIVGKAISGAANSTISFLSSLANRECIAFGEAMEAPMRMTFENVSVRKLPGSNIYENQAKLREGKASISLSSVIIKMRELGTGSTKTLPDDINVIQRVETAPAEEQRQMSQPSSNPPSQVLEQSILTNPVLPQGLQSSQKPLFERSPSQNPASPQTLNQNIRDGVGSDPVNHLSTGQTSQNHHAAMPGKDNRAQLQQRMSVESILTKTRSELKQPRNNSSSELINAFRPK